MLLINEEGFLATTILGIGGIIAIFCLIVIVILWIAAYAKAADAYESVGSAMDFAVTSVVIEGTTGTSDDNESDCLSTDSIEYYDVLERFIEAFCKITEGSYYDGEFVIPGLPDNIVLKDFYPVYPGDPIPPKPIGPGMPRLEGEEADQPGYVVHVDVPIYAGGLWNIEPARVEMKLYRMLQASPLQGGY